MTDESIATTNVYEGLFLFPQAAATDLQSALDHLTGILDRASAEILSLCKWDERRLAYEIKGNKRGVYFLAYLRIDPTSLVGIERDCNLSEQILRAMITRADHLATEVIEAADGRQRLADEIRLRGESEESRSAASASATATASATTSAGE